MVSLELYNGLLAGDSTDLEKNTLTESHKTKAPLNLKVYGEEELQNRIRSGTGCPTNIISIGDPGSQLPAEIFEDATKLLVLRFMDLDVPLINHDTINERLVEQEDIEKAIVFARRVDLTQGLTIHCWQGLARSASIALCLLYWYYEDYGVAELELRRIRPFAKPNHRILSLFDESRGTCLLEIGKRFKLESVRKMVRNFRDKEASNLEEL